MKFDLGIRAGFTLRMAESFLPEQDIFFGIKNGVIAAIAPFQPLHKKKSKKFIDAKDSLVLPGYINGHTHLPMTLFRGLEDDVAFSVWLFDRILPLEAALVTKDFVKAGTDLAMLECIRFGVTTTADMYMYAGAVAESVDKAGLRALITQTFASFPLPEDKDLGTDKGKIFRALKKKYEKHRRIYLGLGPHAPYSCSDELLLEVKRLAEENAAFVHIHVSETKGEVEESLKKFQMSPVERLHKLGLLRKNTICAHCVHLSEKDRDIFARSGASVVYNPDSNAKLSSGIAPIIDYLKRKIPVAIGTDGAASNNNLSITGAMNLGTKLQKLAASDNTAMTAKEALYMATLGAAKALGIDSHVGSLELAKRADIQIIPLQKAHLQPLHDPISQLVYASHGAEVDTLICEGKLVMHKGKILTLSERKIFSQAEFFRKKIQKQLEEMKRA